MKIFIYYFAVLLFSIQVSAQNESPAIDTFDDPVAITSYNAKLYIVDQGSATDLLAKLKETFSNKYLLLDIWATGCSSCIKEMEFGKKLYNETRDLPIEFIYICTAYNTTTKNWTDKLELLQQPGIHIFLSDTIMKQLMKDLRVNGFPNYALFDKEGKYHHGAIRRMCNLNREKMVDIVNRK